MCTLLIGHQALGRGTLLVAANRDEDPSRPSEPPGPLRSAPRVAGGRDVLAGGTWLAVRERRAVVAVLNRRDLAGAQSGSGAERGAGEPAPASRRSRGLLALETAGVEGAVEDASALADAALRAARRSLAAFDYAPFALAFLSPVRCWLLTHEIGAPPRIQDIAPGWHVLTHADLDDTSEPRTARLVRSLSSFRPRGEDEALAGLLRLLSLHDDAGAAGAQAAPVCIHGGRVVTVSSALVSLAPASTRYLHLEGRPCEASPADCAPLLSGALPVPAAG